MFKQVVVMGVKRPSYINPSAEAIAGVQAWASAQVITGWKKGDDGEKRATYTYLDHLVAGHGEYAVPASPLTGARGKPFRWQYSTWDDHVLLREADDAASRMNGLSAWRDIVPKTAPEKIQPAMLPKRGHIALLVSGGLLGTNEVSDNGKSVLVKGSISKNKVMNMEPVESDDGDTRYKITEREVFETRLSVLTEHELQVHTSPREIAAVLDRFVEQIAEAIQSRMHPLYDMKPKAWEWKAFDDLSRQRTMPGRVETGLTDFQRHLAIAMGRLIIKSGAGVINAEMGSGKTTIALAIAEYLRVAQQRAGCQQSAYPAMVVGPGIVTGAENWPKEIGEVIPGASARVITVGAKPQAKPVKIATYVRDVLRIEVDEAAAEGLKPTEVLAHLRREANDDGLRVDDAVWGALYESLCNAERVRPPKRRGATLPNLLDGRIGGYSWLGMDIPLDPASESDLEGRYSLAQFANEYRAGQLPDASFAVVSYETAKLSSGRVPAMPTRIIRTESTDELVRVCVCPHCGNPVQNVASFVVPESADEFVAQKRRFCNALIKVREWNEESGTHIEKSVPCRAPLFSNSALRRIPAAQYAKRLKGFFGLCLVDEVHKAKAKGTGTGYALTTLAGASRYLVGLTGTLFGGYSTSIFWLLYRLTSSVRREFEFNDEKRWVEKYGLLKRESYADTADDGAFTGARRNSTVSEIPGISPAIVGLALGYCTFSSLKDIGLPLPMYDEEIVRIPMSRAMEEQYAVADGSLARMGLFAWALARMKSDDGLGGGAISVWLNTALNRPDAMFRPETVWFRPRLSGHGRYAVYKEELVKTLPAVVTGDELLPKEQWLVNQCQAERAQGRKVLVYVRQTGEHRDIQGRIERVLETSGLRVGTLSPSIAPAKRGTWIKQNAGKFDVLLTNAKLVEVGLNLTMFSTAIFFEMEWSLYVIWQAMRRLYRPGASKPVKLYFPVYEGTLEERAMDLIGSKMMAAQVFYGNEVGGALVEESDDATGNLLNDLVRSAMGKLDIGRAEGVFATTNTPAMTGSAMGSPTAKSPTLPRPVLMVRPAPQPSGRGQLPRASASAAQMSLF